MQTIVEIHAIQNYAPSNLNRDDTGAPKDAFFGGTRRARISSQCLKRAVRTYFLKSLSSFGFTVEDFASRTKRASTLVAQRLTALGREESEAKLRVAQALSAVELSVKEDRTEYLMFFGSREISQLADVVHAHWELLKPPTEAIAESDGKKKTGKKEKAAKMPSEVTKAVEAALNGGNAIDLALFGRMLADLPEKNVNASCQVAHAISTHAINREFDYYTAIDDLAPEDQTGADMLGTVEFNSACFYRYAALNWGDFCRNLHDNKELAAKGLQAFVSGFVVAEPTGKQNSFAAHNPPEFVLVKIRHDASPRSLANAFEAPVRSSFGKTLTGLSAQALLEKDRTLSKAYGENQMDKAFVLNLASVELGSDVQEMQSLPDLIARIGQEVLR
jgi:CRISPR system Cascade subunit CasC